MGVLYVSMEIGHVFVHLLHFIHFSLLTSNLYRDIGLNKPYMAPKGQINLQKGLAINTDAIMVSISKKTFQEKNKSYSLSQRWIHNN